MILAVDAGNTHIVIGCLDSRKKHFVGRISTNRQGTADEYAMLMKNLLALNGVSPASIEGSILANVVPQISHILSGALERLVGKPPIVVGPGVKTGLNIKIDDPGQLGADLVALGVAAMAKYPLPLIVFDLDTATSVSVINEKGLYIGGMLLPGVMTGLTALTASTSQLPNIDLTGVEGVIGGNTIECMRNGIILGHASQVDGLIGRIEAELGAKACAIATGGSAPAVIPHCTKEITVDMDLILDGLLLIYNRNHS